MIRVSVLKTVSVNVKFYGSVENNKNYGLSEVGFEPTPTEVDCDLNAAP